MHPALSVIFFTTSAGAGYGLVIWLGILVALGATPVQPVFGVAALVVALILFTVGLLSSTLHLGRPERAWRALSQWRTSWLSREGVASIVTYVPVLLFGLFWFVQGAPRETSVVLGLIAAVMSVLTVICTAMIYASLKPIRQWHNRMVPVNYLLIALYAGALWLAGVTAFWQGAAARLPGAAAILFGIVALLMKLVYWRRIDTHRSASTIGSATGLGHLGPVRMLEAPHTEENYLLREMGYAIGRKHARSLRVLAVVIGWVLPILLVLGAMLTPPALAMLMFPPAAILAFLGLLCERWLFFAEATHTVTLYYGRAA
jgi:sulfite dehydrogenase (quinone) subunit SoeC